jgi:RNA polymerase sigma factor (sigma-70 family)
MLADRDDAEDVTQDVVIQVWFSLASFTGASAFTTWLYRMVVNRCLNHVRRRPVSRPVNSAPLRKRRRYSADLISTSQAQSSLQRGAGLCEVAAGSAEFGGPAVGAVSVFADGVATSQTVPRCRRRNRLCDLVPGSAR